MTTYWYFYLVRCCDHTLYGGIASDLDACMAEHDAGSASKYTRAKGPVRLVHWERFYSKSAAARREAAVKKLPKNLKERIVLGDRGAQINQWEGMDHHLPRPVKRRDPQNPD